MDCLEGLKLLPDKSVDIILTDPPYNIGFKPPRKLKPSGGGGYARNGIANDNMSECEFTDWLDKVCFQLNRVLKDDSYIFMFSGWSTIYQFQPILMKYWQIKSLHIWEKDNFGIGYYSRPQYEPFFMCLKGTPQKPSKAPSDIWRFKKVYKSKANPVVHSCQKPTELLETILKTYSEDSEVVLDPFMGSGSTAVASLKLGKSFVGFELIPEFIEIANKRLDSL